jgi:hypothetical protein
MAEFHGCKSGIQEENRECLLIRAAMRGEKLIVGCQAEPVTALDLYMQTSRTKDDEHTLKRHCFYDKFQ